MAEASALSLYAALLRGELEGDAALDASRHIFDLVMNNVEQAIWWKDVNSVYLGCNYKLARYAGARSPSELIGKTDADCAWGELELPRSGTTWFQDYDRTVVESGEPVIGLREQVRIADGQVMWVETNKVPLKDLEGNVIGTLGTFTDISDRIEAENELQRTLEMLDERVKAGTSQAEAIRDIAASIARSLQLDDVIEQVLRGVERLLEHRRSFIALYDGDGAAELAGERVPGSIESEPAEPHTVVPDLLEGVDSAVSSSAESGARFRADGSVVFPLAVGEHHLGFLAVEPDEGQTFSSEDVGLMATVADQASSAISNSRALLVGRTVAAVEERQRLANDLHDSVSQTLWTATLLAQNLARNEDLNDHQRDQVERLRVLTTGALSEMRALLLELRPEVIETTSLPDLIGQLASAFESRKKATCTVELAAIPELLPTVKVALYRIVQESLNNVARHAEATEVTIRLTKEADEVCVSVADNGIGFDVDSCPEHMGLRIMAERATSIDACFDVQSSVGHGTVVRVKVTDTVGLEQ